ncbi:hypothetical protein JCM8202_003824 [Rhodotorula sphaerocarpa]
MSINPALLSNAPAAEADSSTDEEDALEEGTFFVDHLLDVAVKDQVAQGISKAEWGSPEERYEIRYLVRWYGYEAADDTWEPKRNLNQWQESYDEDLRRIAERDPSKADLGALQAEADRLNAAWRAAEKKKAEKRAAKAAKSAAKKRAQSLIKSPDAQQRAVKRESSAPLLRGRQSETVSASPAPNASSRAARSLRRNKYGSEAIDQEALNEFIASNAPRGIRTLRFTPPPRHDDEGNLVPRSSDTESEDAASPRSQRPAPETAETTLEIPQPVSVASATADLGFAGSSDDDEEDVAAVTTAPFVKTEADTAGDEAAVGATYSAMGFAGSSSDEEVVEQLLLPRREPTPSRPVEGPERLRGSAEDRERDDRSAPAPGIHSRQMQPSEPPTSGARADAGDAFGGFAGDEDDDDVGEAPSAFADDEGADDDGAGAVFPDLTSETEVRSASALQASIEPAAAPVDAALSGFAGDSDDDDDYDDEPNQDEAENQAAQQRADLSGLPRGDYSSFDSSTGHEATEATPTAPLQPAQIPDVSAQSRPTGAVFGSIGRSFAASPPAVSPPAMSGTAPSERDQFLREPAATGSSKRRLLQPLASPELKRQRRQTVEAEERRGGTERSGQQQKWRRSATGEMQQPERPPVKEVPASNLGRIKFRKTGESGAPSQRSPVDVLQPSPGPSGGSGSMSGTQQKASDDLFNQGRSRVVAKNGFIELNADALRSKNLSQTLTAGSNYSWPHEVYMMDEDPEVAKIKYLWSVGADFGSVANGTDSFDEDLLGLGGAPEVWIGPPPSDAQAGIDRSARDQLHDYYALQVLVSSYPNVRQADSPRRTVRAVFVHNAKMHELGATAGKFADLEHLRSKIGVRFYTYGRVEKGKQRPLLQIWRSATALTFTPSALDRQGEGLERLLKKFAAHADRLTRDVFPWLPVHYVGPDGPLGGRAQQPTSGAKADGEEADASAPDGQVSGAPANDPRNGTGSSASSIHREAKFKVLSILARDELDLANFAPQAGQTPIMHPVFPFGHDKVSLGGPERHFFDVLGTFCRDLSLSRLQKIVASWRPQYPLIRRWAILCTQQELATAQTLPGIELLTIHDVDQRLLA